MFKFNYAQDGAIFEPVAKGYRSLPVGIRKGTGNVVDNLRSILTFSNNVLYPGSLFTLLRCIAANPVVICHTPK